MAITLGTHVSAAQTVFGGSKTTGAIDTTGCNLLVAAICDSSTSGAIDADTVSDSKSNTWTALTLRTDINGARFYYVASPTVGSGHTFTANSPNGWHPAIAVVGFIGAKASSPFDSEQWASGQGVATLQSTSLTPAADNEVLVSVLSHVNADTDTISGSGWSIIEQVSAQFRIVMAYKIQTTAGAESPTFNWTTNSDPIVLIAAFKDPGTTPLTQTASDNMNDDVLLFTGGG